MRNLTRGLLWVFVFIVPWDVVSLPVVGGLSRVAGIAMLGAALLTTLVERRFRRPGAIFLLAGTVVGFNALSLLWTISYPDTLGLVLTAVQMLASVWVVQQFAREQCDRQALLVAFCLGELVPLAGVLNSFRVGAQVWWMRDRYSGIGLNADDLAITLVIGVPIAWFVFMRYRGTCRAVVRATALAYFVVAPVGVVLTGTRGAVLAGVVAISIAPLTLKLRSARSALLVGSMLLATAGAAAWIVPDRTWARIMTIKSEVLEGGSMSGRAAIWEAGLTVFPQRPLLGVGLGAYGAAVESILNRRHAPHNLALGLLVEQGVIGLSIYFALLGACAVAVFRMPPLERKLWAVVLLAWLVGVMSLNWEYRKVTWLLFGLVAAQSAADRVGRRQAVSALPLTVPRSTAPFALSNPGPVDWRAAQ